MHSRWTSIKGALVTLVLTYLFVVAYLFGQSAFEQSEAARDARESQASWVGDRVPRIFSDKDGGLVLPDETINRLTTLFEELRHASNNTQDLAVLLASDVLVDRSRADAYFQAAQESCFRRANSPSPVVNVCRSLLADSLPVNAVASNWWADDTLTPNRNRAVEFARLQADTYEGERGKQDYRVEFARKLGFADLKFQGLKIPLFIFAEQSGERVTFPLRRTNRLTPYKNSDRPWWRLAEELDRAKRAPIQLGKLAVPCGITDPYEDIGPDYQLVRTLVCTDRHALSGRNSSLYMVGIDLVWTPSPPPFMSNLELLKHSFLLAGGSGTILVPVVVVLICLLPLTHHRRRRGIVMERRAVLTALNGVHGEQREQDREEHTVERGAMLGPKVGWLRTFWHDLRRRTESDTRTWTTPFSIRPESEPEVRGREFWALKRVAYHSLFLFGVRVIWDSGRSRIHRRVEVTHTGHSEVEIKYLDASAAVELDLGRDDAWIRRGVEKSVLSGAPSAEFLEDELSSELPPDPLPERLEKVSGEVGRYLRQLKRTNFGRFRFDDGVALANALYADSHVKSLIGPDYIIKVAKSGESAVLDQGDVIERTFLFQSKESWEKFRVDHALEISLMAEAHQNSRAKLRVGFQSSLKGTLMAFTETDFSIVDDRFVIVVEGSRPVRLADDETKALIYGYVSWKPADVDFYNYVLKQVHEDLVPFPSTGRQGF